jgi:hypothetical protein
MKAMVLASAMMAMMSAANAANITRDFRTDGTVNVSVTGEINPGDEENFRRTVAPLPDGKVFVFLSSPGGNVAAGLSIGAQIRARRFTTEVFDRCASVCGLMWLAGESRAVLETASIGFHAAYDSNGQVSSEANAVIGAYLDRLGFSYAAVRFLTHTSPNSMQWLNANVAEQYGITAIVLPATPVPPVSKASGANPNNSSNLEATPSFPPWLLFIPAIVMGLFTLGFITKTIG